MVVRITYRSEIYIEAESLNEVREKFDGLNLDPADRHDVSVKDFGFIEINSVEDADTGDDLKSEYRKLDNNNHSIE